MNEPLKRKKENVKVKNLLTRVHAATAAMTTAYQFNVHSALRVISFSIKFCNGTRNGSRLNGLTLAYHTKQLPLTALKTIFLLLLLNCFSFLFLVRSYIFYLFDDVIIVTNDSLFNELGRQSFLHLSRLFL